MGEDRGERLRKRAMEVPLRRSIMAALGEGEVVTAWQVADELGADYGNAAYHLTYLEQAGMVRGEAVQGEEGAIYRIFRATPSEAPPA